MGRSSPSLKEQPELIVFQQPRQPASHPDSQPDRQLARDWATKRVSQAAGQPGKEMLEKHCF